MTHLPADLSPYLLALSVSGVRCFAEPQTLALSHDGRPARWTILLGDNGTGKTTLLQLLAYLRPSPAALSVEFGAEPPLTTAGYADLLWRSWVRSGIDGIREGHATLRVGLSGGLGAPSRRAYASWGPMRLPPRPTTIQGRCGARLVDVRRRPADGDDAPSRANIEC